MGKRTKEIWKPIKEYIGYEISSFGRVKSLNRKIKVVRNGKKFLQTYWGRILKQIRINGYLYVGLSSNSNTKLCQIHRLVAKEFLRTPSPSEQVNHLNCNKKDNHVNNLKWTSRSENMKHASVNGLLNIKKGKDSHYAKLTEKEVLEIRKLYKTGKYTQQKIGDRYNISQSCIHKIVKKIRWRHLK